MTTTARADARTSIGFPSREECLALYKQYFCEENVYRELQLAVERGVPAENLFAIFISNPQRFVAFQAQRMGHGHVCFWDYHVVGVMITGKDAQPCAYVFDMDSVLPFPTELKHYVRQSILSTLPDAGTYTEVCPMNQAHEFRVVSYEELRSWFSSDRSHMHAPKNTWTNESSPEFNTPPPSFPCITASKAAHQHTMPIFLKMSVVWEDDKLAPGQDLGDVPEPGHLFSTVEALLHFFSGSDQQSG